MAELKTFKLENGPFNNGPEVAYVVDRTASSAKAWAVGNIDDFTPAEVAEVDDAPENADVHIPETPAVQSLLEE